ncbi:MAG: hypothetical protein RR107_02085 [Clostridia bacterium]
MENWQRPILDVNYYIKINGKEVPQMYSSYNVKNVLTYLSTPDRYSTGQSNNTEVNNFYITTIEFNFAFMPIALYQEILQKINTPKFEVVFYDYTTNKVAIRDCYLSDDSIEKIHVLGNQTKGVINLSIKFVSIYAYKTYADLKSNTPILR